LGGLKVGGEYAKDKWPGISSRARLRERRLRGALVVYDKKWSKWSPNGKTIANDEPIDEVDRNKGRQSCCLIIG